MAENDDDGNDLPLEVPAEQRDTRRLEQIYHAKERAEQLQTTTFAGDQSDESAFFRATKAYYVQLEWLLRQSEHSDKYLNRANLGAVTKEDAIRAGVIEPQDNSKSRSRNRTRQTELLNDGETLVHIQGLAEFGELEPMISVPVSKPGNSRSKGRERIERQMAVPKRITEKALRTLNGALSDLNLDLQVEDSPHGAT